MTTIPRAGAHTNPPTTEAATTAEAAGTSAESSAAVAGRWAHAVADRRAGHSLEGPFYTDPDFYQRDLEAVFHRSWIFAASVAELPEPGDYVTLDIGRASVILIRDDDERIRAHHNVCRHRGARLLTDASGSVGNIVCGYHQWTYSPEGDLLHAGAQAPDFNPACFSLLSVQVKVAAGLIFLCLAKHAPDDIEDVAARITPYIAPHALERTKVAFQEDIVEQANWKLVMENNRECYHCEAGHPELTCTFFPTYGYRDDEIPTRLLPAHDRCLAAEQLLSVNAARNGLLTEPIEELSGRATGFRIQREALDGAGESYTKDGRAGSRKLLGEFDTPVLGRLSLHVQPNSWFHFLGDHVVTFSLVPLSVDRTLLRTTWLVHEDAEEGVDYDLPHLTEVWHRTNEQDAQLCVRAQWGVSSPAYVPGPYAPHEYQVEEFIAWYIERLRAYGGIDADAAGAAGTAGAATEEAAR
ncbi:aromatic ring-hydroxylating oxygenase subunit alpha [Brevibacterium jeotgali]|uniref:Rieske 2Fe-2S family protein n=1 Tax=Brevibacterium jeotgali TaxID=1262550 RepID=A0A2H1L3H2_9MICO|nr:aromatic ring-hydroxylating dioxygenase subunit alpha [Brevibacterium jeotgali]TWC01691.1 Rieske 2Fe-2S family protein [Brevibacterium jeotgali]SMY11436.1 Rieske 2Fe-2S family protein [Brevibacterium jeotgali]